MFSRLSCLRAVTLPKSTSVFNNVPHRAVTYISKEAIPLPSPTDAPERDHVNYPRPTLKDFHPPVRFLVFPDTWFTFFYNKTGVTGPYMLGIGFLSFCMSKEYLLFYHHHITHLKGVLLWLYIAYITDMGQIFARKIFELFQKDTYDSYTEFWANLNTSLEELVEHEQKEVVRFAAQKDIIAAKRENVGLQLEAVYRERALDIYNKIKRKLDYHVEIGTVAGRIQQQYMVDWVINNVKSSITPEQEKDSLKKCIADLQLLAAKV